MLPVCRHLVATEHLALTCQIAKRKQNHALVS